MRQAKHTKDSYVGLFLFLIAIVVWLIGFILVYRLGTWITFAIVSPILAAIALRTDKKLLPLLSPSISKVGIGILAGILMVVGTHIAFSLVVLLIPAIQVEAVKLYQILNLTDFSPEVQAFLIVVIASCEEILFRGTFSGRAVRKDMQQASWTLTRLDLVKLIVIAVGYALGTVTLGSPLLVICAFVCGLIWGILRLLSRSVLTPIITHVIWDIGIFIVWPLL